MNFQPVGPIKLPHRPAPVPTPTGNACRFPLPVGLTAIILMWLAFCAPPSEKQPPALPPRLPTEPKYNEAEITST